jgi:transketolase
MQFPTYEAALIAVAEANPAVMVLTAGETPLAVDELFARLGSRFLDVGAGAQALVGAAAGLALRGRIPICHAPATLLALRAFEFIRTDVGFANLPVKLVGFESGLLSGPRGPSHQALEDLGVMRGVPRMQVFAPADVDDLVAMLPAVVASKAPAYLRHTPLAAGAPHPEPFEIGRCETLAEGNDVALIASGLLVSEALRARVTLQEHGVRARVLNARSLKPLDERLLLRAAFETRLVVTIEDHFLTGGLFSAVAEALARHHAGPHAAARVFPVALEERPFHPAPLGDVLAHEELTGEKIAARVLVALG